MTQDDYLGDLDLSDDSWKGEQFLHVKRPSEDHSNYNPENERPETKQRRDRVVELALQGLASPAIAERLGISESCVRSDAKMRNITTKQVKVKK